MWKRYGEALIGDLSEMKQTPANRWVRCSRSSGRDGHGMGLGVGFDYQGYCVLMSDCALSVLYIVPGDSRGSEPLRFLLTLCLDFSSRFHTRGKSGVKWNG